MTSTTKARSLNLGVTLHSFAAEFRSYIWSFEDLMYNAGQLGGGVEIVGPSNHRNFPQVPEEFIAVFRSSVVRNGLTATAYGAYADPFMLPHRDLTSDELVAYMLPQVVGAARLGMSVVRTQHFSAESIERLLPTAEKVGVKLGYELHVPLDLESARTRVLIEQVERINSPFLGLIPDAGIFTHSITAARLEAGLAFGLSEEQVDQVVALWTAKGPYEAADELVKSFDAGQATLEWTERIWGAYGHSKPADLTPIFHHIIHLHAKFYSLRDSVEPDIPYRDLVFTLLDNGYDGWISSEFQPYFGFSSVYKEKPVDAFDSIAQQQAMIRRYVDEYNALRN